MANIAEMVKELQQERDRLNQAIAALAPLAQKARWAKLRSENSAKAKITAQ